SVAPEERRNLAMATQTPAGSFRAEWRLILQRMVVVWRLVPAAFKRSLAIAALLMALASTANMAVALLLGRMVDGVTTCRATGTDPAQLYQLVLDCLLLIAGAYVLREALHVLRRYLVENTCTRVNRDMLLRLVDHMMRVDVEKLRHDKVGALHTRMS